MPVKKTTISSVPQKYGRYEVVKLIGEGAMGKVFLARDPVLKRQVAIKIVSMEKQLDENIRKEFLKRFTIEARLSAQLSHPSIVPVYDAGEEGDMPWIAFQYVEGIPLDKLLKTHGKLPIKVALSIAANISSALQQAHKINVVHRDIKPSNIIIDRHGGIAKLMDFGVAKSPLASLTMEGNAMGSPGYMSPEQIEGRELDHRSDLFSLGVVLYEMVTGNHPFRREDLTSTAYATISGKYTSAKLLNKDIPARLEGIIAQCLIPEPDKRIPDAEHLLKLLEALSSRSPAGSDTIRMLTVLQEGTLSFARKGWLLLNAAFRALIAYVRKTSGRGERTESGTVIEQPFAATVTGKASVVSKRPFALTAVEMFRKLMGQLNHFIRTGPSRARLARISLLCGAAVLAILLIGPLVFRPAPVALWLPSKIIKSSDSILMAEFQSFYREAELDSAFFRAELLMFTESNQATGLFLQGLVECKKKNFDKAAKFFDSAQASDRGKLCIANNAHYMAMRYALVNERAPDKLVRLLAKYFQAARDSRVKTAVYGKPYWPRWNALRILQTSGKRVDLVRVFLLDLKYSTSRSVRLLAVRDLGELGDRRAIGPLKLAAKQKRKDPVVAAAAGRVLRKVFKED